jgi:hypothetical protein
MPAELLHRERLDFDDGAVVEMVLWRVPEPVAGCRHSYKYRLYYGTAGKRIVGCDNERGKGDHRHRRGRQEPYRFTTVERLVSDFLADVAKERAQ